MREKYIEERFPRYFIFGQNTLTGKVDISDGTQDVACNISINEAYKIISERDKVVDFIRDMANAFEECCDVTFSDFWYGR